MKKTIITTVLAALSVSTAMAANIANFTNATEQQNPYAQSNAQSNAQVQSQAVELEQVNYGKVNGKVVNPLFKYTGQSTAGQVSAETSSVRVSH